MRISDWSSDVCSSDLGGTDQDVERAVRGDDVFDQASAGVELGDVAGGEMDVEAGRFPAERLNALVAGAQVAGAAGAALRRHSPAHRVSASPTTARTGPAAPVHRSSPVPQFLPTLAVRLLLPARLGG